MPDIAPIDDDLEWSDAVDLTTPPPPVRGTAMPTAALCVCRGGRVPCIERGRSCESCGISFQVSCGSSPRRHCAACLVLTHRCPRCNGSFAAADPANPVCPHGCVARRALGGYHHEAPQIYQDLTLPPLADSLTVDPLVGFEIECVRRDFPDEVDPLAALERSSVATLIAGIESDSSLPANGCEIVSVPLLPDVWRDTRGALWRTIDRIATVDPATCGGHIHLTALPWVRRGAEVISASYGIAAILDVWAAVAGRAPTQYCRAPQPRAAPPYAQSSLSEGHSWALIASTHGTIEWRHPAGTLSGETALGRMELILDVLRHASTWSPAAPWHWGAYLPTLRRGDGTRYAWALCRSLGLI